MSAPAGIPTGPGVPDWVPPITVDDRLDRLEAGLSWQEGGDPLPPLDINLTTPERAKIVASRMSDADGGSGVDYGWIGIAFARELGNRPVTGWASRTEAQKSYGGSDVARGYGKDQEAHGHEITAGLFPSRATVVANGTNVLSSIVPTDASSQFAGGMAIRGDGAFPAGRNIVSIIGRRGAPLTMTLDGTVPAGSYTVRARDVTGLRELMGMLVTFNGGDSADPDWLANSANGIGIHFQSYNDYSRARNSLQFGQSAVDPTNGRVLRFASTEFERGISVESVIGTNFLVVSSGTFSGGVLSFSGVTAASGLSFSSSGSYSSGAAIQMGGQNIGFDQTTGTKLGTSSLQKMAVLGATPIARQTVAAAATDPATTQTLANSLRAIAIGFGFAA